MIPDEELELNIANSHVLSQIGPLKLNDADAVLMGFYSCASAIRESCGLPIKIKIHLKT